MKKTVVISNIPHTTAKGWIKRHKIFQINRQGIITIHDDRGAKLFERLFISKYNKDIVDAYHEQLRTEDYEGRVIWPLPQGYIRSLI
jgi:hypothetical protein